MNFLAWAVFLAMYPGISFNVTSLGPFLDLRLIVLGLLTYSHFTVYQLFSYSYEIIPIELLVVAVLVYKQRSTIHLNKISVPFFLGTTDVSLSRAFLMDLTLVL